MHDGKHHEGTPGLLKARRRAALGAVVALLAPASAAVAGTTSSIPSPSSTSYLNGVVCASTSDCWVVGSDRSVGGAYLNQLQRWNGRKWKLMTVPQPGGETASSQNDLQGASCSSKSNCWAVGEYTSGGPQLNEILRWNGKKWSTVATPQPGGKGSGAINDLFGVTCPSAKDCWAIGVFTGKSGGFLNQTLHWNGKKWTHVTAPDPGGSKSSAFNVLQGVACASSSSCWAGGDFETSAYFNQALRWNGKKWSDVKTPQPGPPGNDINSIVCSSAVDCVAVGDSGGGRLNQVLAWNGQHWSPVTAPSPGGTALNDQSQLTGVDCTSKAKCWAVGYFETNLGPSHDQALRWNGKKWSQVTTPQPGASGNQLNGISCVSASDCWAVGQYVISTQTLDLALHWNGTAWSQG
jgi:hypothetical protein